MSSEDFPWDSGHHPEVASNPEQMSPATQSTLRGLRDAVIDKTQDVPEVKNKRGIELYTHSDAPSPAAVVQAMKKGARTQFPDVVCIIQRHKQIEGGDHIVTSYFIHETPDSLHISRYVKSVRSAEGVARYPLGNEGEALADLTQWQRETAKAQVEEGELGLDFVSEDEASRLLEFLDPLEPRPKA